MGKIKLIKKICYGLVFLLAAGLGFSTSALAVTNPQNGGIGLQGVISTIAPTQGATIVSPANGQVFSTLPIDVTGWCPNDLLIKIFKNNAFSGSVLCSQNTYTIKIDLFSGRNDLVARDYDALDQSGPDSNTVSVTFNDSTNTPNISRITLTSNYARRGANPGDSLTWPIIIDGGTPPYAISVDWGDSSDADVYSVLVSGDFTVKHTYSASGSYRVLIKGTDKNSGLAYLQLVAIANGQAEQAATASTSQAACQQSDLWEPAVIAIPLILLAFWLGRKSEEKFIKDRLKKGEHPF